VAGFAEGWGVGVRAGTEVADTFGRGFEATRRLFVDAENKKAAQAVSQQLAGEMREWDNQTALKEAELAQLEEHSMADGEVDAKERNLLKAQRAKIETGRFDAMMNRLSQVTAEQGATNPYIEQMVKPLFEQTTTRMQQFYNGVAQEFEEHKLKEDTETSNLDREQRSMAAANEQQGAWDRANLGEQGALDRVLAGGEQDRLTQAEGAKLGRFKGAQKTLSIAPDKLEELANANVDSTYAKEIAAGEFTPAMRQTALRMSRRDLVRTYSRAGVEFNEGALDEPEAGAEGATGDQETDERVKKAKELGTDIDEVQAQIAGLTERGKGHARAMRGKRHTPESEGKAKDYDAELTEAKSLLAELMERFKALESGQGDYAREANKAKRESIRSKYAKAE
jgi:hypothetical protein